MYKRRIVCFGDSISAGWGLAPQDAWPVLLGSQLPLQGFTCIGAGVPGDTSEDALARIERDVLRHTPAVACIQFGLNDCMPEGFFADSGLAVPLARFEQAIRSIVNTIQASGAKVMLLTSHPCVWEGGEGMRYEVNRKQYNACLRRVAASMGLALCDIEEAWNGLDAKSLRLLLAPDGVHLSSRGNRAYADCVAQSLLPLT